MPGYKQNSLGFNIWESENGATAQPMKNAAARESALSDDVIKTCNGDGDQSPAFAGCAQPGREQRPWDEAQALQIL